jgi:hypothetical protein
MNYLDIPERRALVARETTKGFWREAYQKRIQFLNRKLPGLEKKDQVRYEHFLGFIADSKDALIELDGG